jgi:RNA polymerase sigma-70 factor, ECF subfamily
MFIATRSWLGSALGADARVFEPVVGEAAGARPKGSLAGHARARASAGARVVRSRPGVERDSHETAATGSVEVRPEWTARSAPPRSRGAKNRFGTSFVWIQAMHDFTIGLASRKREGLLGDPTSTTMEERFLRLAGSELDRAYRLAGFLLGDAHEAEDATQEALIRAWQSIGALRDPDTFRPWFDRILVNLCRDRLRRRRRINFVPLDATAEFVRARDPFGAILDRDEVLVLMNGLDADERIVIVLHYWADLTLAAVAQRLGWPIGTVKSRLHRALDRMAGSPGGRGGR